MACRLRDLLSIVVQPLDLHLVNVGSIPTGPTHGKGLAQGRATRCRSLGHFIYPSILSITHVGSL